MSTYLKLDAELPAGLNYLNLNAILLPQPLWDVGGLTNGFNFILGIDDLVGNSEVIGNPVKKADGYEFGSSGYIDTKLTESEEFLWVSLGKVPANVETTAGRFAPLISSWVNTPLSPTGFTLGTNMGVKSSTIKLLDTANGDFNAFFNTKISNADAGKWVLIAISRINTADGYSLHFSSKLQGTSITTATANGTSGRNDQLPVYVGHTPTDSGLFTLPKTINFASIHNKGLTASELGNLMNSLITELSTQDIIL